MAFINFHFPPKPLSPHPPIMTFNVHPLRKHQTLCQHITHSASFFLFSPLKQYVTLLPLTPPADNNITPSTPPVTASQQPPAPIEPWLQFHKYPHISNKIHTRPSPPHGAPSLSCIHPLYGELNLSPPPPLPPSFPPPIPPLSPPPALPPPLPPPPPFSIPPLPLLFSSSSPHVPASSSPLPLPPPNPLPPPFPPLTLPPSLLSPFPLPPPFGNLIWGSFP